MMNVDPNLMHLTPWIGAIWGLIGAAFLHAFFAVVRLQWPDAYFSLGDVTAYRISRGPTRYAVFRLVPVAVVSLFAGATAERAGGNATSAIITIVVVHLLSTNVWALRELMRKPASRFNRKSLAAAHAIVTLAIAATATLVRGYLDTLAPLVPTLDEIRSDLWTAVMAAVLGGYLLQSSRGTGLPVVELVQDARERLDATLMSELQRAARANHVDVDLAEAVMLTEALQRPAWLRRLERIKGKFIPQGTYGVMQVKADSPVTDVESIRIAVSDHLPAGPIPVDEYGYPSSAYLRDILRRYNSDWRFVELAENIYFEIRPSSD